MERTATVSILCNQIRMLSANFSGVFILVEGSEDSRLWKRFLNSNAMVVICVTRENAIDVASQFLQSSSVIGIIDSDAEFLVTQRTYPSNVFLTDFRDIEISLFSEMNLNAILNELGSPEKIQAWTTIHGSPYPQLVLQAKIIGALFLVSQQEGLGLTFKDLRWKDFVDRASLQINVKEFVEHVKNKSHRHSLSTDELLQKMTVICNSINSYHIIRGHDIIGIIAFGLQFALGSMSAFDTERVSMAFRLSVSRVQMEKLALFRSLLSWYGERSISLFA